MKGRKEEKPNSLFSKKEVLILAKGPTRPMFKRMIAVLCVLLIVGFSFLTYKLFKLQIIDYKMYQQKAIEQQTRDILVSPKRGTIFDKNGKALAISASAYMVYVAPSAIKDEKQRDTIINGLISVLAITTDVEKEKIKKLCNKKSGYEVVARRIEKDVADKIRELIKKEDLVRCINIAEDPKRYYPFGNFASHIIGFTGADNQGLSGLEDYYDKYLKGVPGRIVTATSARGNEIPFDYEMLIEPQDGNSLVLTIDEVIQHFLEKYLDTACVDYKVRNRAAGIVMDVKNGDILAMSVKPDFDLNAPYVITDTNVLESLKPLVGEDLKAKTSEALNVMWRNKIITEQYEPGSAFKAITSAIAIEENLVNDKDSFVCNGSRVVAGQTIHCQKRAGHGTEDFLQGLENSCNPVFMDIGARIGSENMFKYVTAFGLRAITGIDLPGEGSGFYFPSVKSMGPVQLAVASFGQTFKITPIQLITAVSAIANNGKLLQPHIVKEIKDNKGNIVEDFGIKEIRQVISKDTSVKLSAMLQSVVDNGTGRNAKIAGYKIAGKTATSEKIDEKNELGVANKRIASFIAYAPADDPKIAVLIILDEPDMPTISGGTLVAPIIKHLLSDVLPYLGYEPQLSAEEIAKSEALVPDFIGQDTQNATKAITLLNLKTKIVGGVGPIKYQIPNKGQRIPTGGVIMLYTNDAVPPTNVVVPNISGFSPAAANSAIINAGLNIRFGTSNDVPNMIVGACTPAIGSTVPPGTTITVELRVLVKDD